MKSLPAMLSLTVLVSKKLKGLLSKSRVPTRRRGMKRNSRKFSHLLLNILALIANAAYRSISTCLPCRRSGAARRVVQRIAVFAPRLMTSALTLSSDTPYSMWLAAFSVSGMSNSLSLSSTDEKLRSYELEKIVHFKRFQFLRAPYCKRTKQESMRSGRQPVH